MSNSNTHKRPLDVVIKTRSKDLFTFLQLQRDLLQHSHLHGQVYVVVHPRDLEVYQDVIHKDFHITTMNSLLQLFGYHKDLSDNWGTQQIMKLLAAGIVANEQYLVLDSNTILTYDFDESHFYKGDRFLYAIGDWSDRDWEVPARTFLKLEADGLLFGFRSTNQIFIKEHVLRLVRYLEKVYGQNVVDVLHSQPEAWTEFKLYGYFCRCILKNTRHYFQPSSDLTSVVKRNVEESSYLTWLKFSRPLMIKVYKHRPIPFELSDEEYTKFIAQIKAVY